jgi:hypothetical protein
VVVPVAGAVQVGGCFGCKLSWPAVVAKRRGAADQLPFKANIDDPCLRGAILLSASKQLAISPLLSKAVRMTILQPPVRRPWIDSVASAQSRSPAK